MLLTPAGQRSPVGTVWVRFGVHLAGSAQVQGGMWGAMWGNVGITGRLWVGFCNSELPKSIHGAQDGVQMEPKSIPRAKHGVKMEPNGGPKSVWYAQNGHPAEARSKFCYKSALPTPAGLRSLVGTIWVRFGVHVAGSAQVQGGMWGGLCDEMWE